MRFFLKVKFDGEQLGIRRINYNSHQDDSKYLLQYIAKNLGIACQKLILTLMKQNARLRVIPNWSINKYGIVSGSQFEVELIQFVPGFVRNGNNQEIENIENVNVVCRKEIQPIKEVDQEEKCDLNHKEEEQIAEIVVKAYEELLKIIQKGSTEQFFKTLKSDHSSLGPCQNQFYLIELKKILNQLGQKGWAAIHCAILRGDVSILSYLLNSVKVDVNLKTSDDWTPIQLAIGQEDLQIVKKLTKQVSLNINICTKHGLPIIMAIQTKNIKIIEEICTIKDIDFEKKDKKGRNINQIFAESRNQIDRKIVELVKMEEKRQTLSNLNRPNCQIFHTLVELYRGNVTLIKTPPRSSKQIYIAINPYKKQVQIYQSKNSYPTHPDKLIPISLIGKFRIMEKKEYSWYMKNGKSYILMQTNTKKYIFACDFENTVNEWIRGFEKCFRNIKKYSENIDKFSVNEKPIIDHLKMNQDISKKKQNNFLSFLTNKQVLNDEQRDVERKEEHKNNEKQQNREKNDKNSTDSDTDAVTNAKSLKFSDFKIKKVLGEGSFGKVFLATDLRGQKQQQYVLKCCKKKKLVMNRQIKYIVAELNILKQIDHPFIVNLHFTFQTPNYVYLGLDYCSGKDLSHHLMAQVTFPERQAKIYAAEILLALEYLHGKNIIYRDLKPQNIMIGGDGHLKLVDFGLSKQGDRSDFLAKSFCGSPAYISPEMLIKKGVGKESDYYCFGAVLYQMLVGEPPFFSEDITILYSNIKTGKLAFPKSTSSEAKSLLTKLLERNPQKRLGYKSISQIKDHLFFKQINWNALMNKKIKAPVRYNDEMDDQPIFMEIVHQDFDYSSQNYRINRFVNFSFTTQK